MSKPSGLFRHLLAHFKAQRRLFILGVLALLATNAVQQCIPLLLKYAIDSLQAKASIAVVLLWATLRFGAVLAQGFLRFGWRMGFFGMGRYVEYTMRSQLFDKLLSLPLAYYLKQRTGDLLSRAMSDLATVRESLGFGWLTLLDSVSMILLTIAFMRHLEPGLTLWSLLPLAALPILVATLGRRYRQGTREVQGALDGLSQAATESFSGARVIQAYARQREEQARFLSVSRAYRDKNMDIVRLEAVYWPLLSVISGLSKLILFYVGGIKVAQYMRGVQGGMSLGTFVAMYEYLLQIIWPVLALGFSTNIFVRGKVSVERLNEVYDAEAGIADPPLPKAPPAKAAEVLRLKDAHFSYPGGAEALQGVDLSLRRGEWLGLAGRTGSGKSTLLKLPPRLADPSSGAVELFGLDLRDRNLGQLRAEVGLVMQEPFLFSDTILENIAFGAAATPDLDWARSCARIADLDGFIQTLPLAYASLLGEKGVNLSGGQKQRLALARALYMRPRLLLLDDPFSAVDTATEERIVAGLRQALPDTAVLLVSHRISTLSLCDRVMVLDKGQVAESGTHQDLMRGGGFYAGMARREQLARQSGLGSGPL